MADGVVQLVARLASVSQLPEDTTENVINCGLTGVLAPGDVTTAMEALRDFYLLTSGAQVGTVASRISGTISRTADACSILAYATLDLSGATPMGSPIGQLNFTMGAETATSDVPEEVAVVVSYHADLTDVPVSEPNPTPPPLTIRPQQRRRGRMYIGPCNNVIGSTAGDGFWRPTPNVRTDFGISFDRMATSINGSAGLTLGIWSKADAEVWEAVGGWVDDAFDTQRRRGVSATVRTTFTI